jgi:hypothetical protein
VIFFVLLYLFILYKKKIPSEMQICDENFVVFQIADMIDSILGILLLEEK